MSEDLDNFLMLLDKPEGLYSRTACNIIRGSLKIKKLGFVGTLDPFATGLMIFCANKYTKLSDSLLDLPKTYTATLTLGSQTDTADHTGAVIATKDIPAFSEREVLDVFDGMIGKHIQTPPLYSARKLDGRPLYEYARKNIPVDTSLKKKEISIYSLELLQISSMSITFRTRCSKGTYIRTLGEDIATRLGTLGTLTSLCREKIGEFELNKASSLEDIKNSRYQKIYL